MHCTLRDPQTLTKTETKLQKPVNNTEYVEIKWQLDVTEVFNADLIAC